MARGAGGGVEGYRCSLFESGNRLHQCSKLATAFNPSCNCMSATALCSYSNLPQLPLPSPLVPRRLVGLGQSVCLLATRCLRLSLSLCLPGCVCECVCFLFAVCVFGVSCGLCNHMRRLATVLHKWLQIVRGDCDEKERTQSLQLHLHAYIYPINEAESMLFSTVISATYYFIHYMSHLYLQAAGF